MPNGLVAAIHRKNDTNSFCGAVSDFPKVFLSEMWELRVQLPNLAGQPIFVLTMINLAGRAQA